jgi:endoglucanase
MSAPLLPRLTLLALVLLVLLPAVPGGVPEVGAQTTRAQVVTAEPVSVRVEGTSLVDGRGRPLRLLGVNRSGSEYACVQGWGLFEGPTDTAAIAAMKSWKINAVRVPLNEHCWLGINGVAPALSGSAYRDAVAALVGRLNDAGLVAVLDLHWSAAGRAKALEQQVMANADHSPAFWSSVAATFKSNPGVVFDLFNEPHDISWKCWRDGCTTAAGWQAAGMQSLLDAVRGTGARQPVLLSGNNWGGDLSQWLAHRPVDPAGQTVASAHIYSFSQCNTPACWESTLAPVARVVPVVTAELGEDTCTGDFVTRYMDWADSRGVGYLGWTWNPWDCRTGPALISSWDGAPTAFGRHVRDRFAALAAEPAPVPSPTATSSPAPSGAPGSGGTLVYGFEVPWQAETPGAAVGPTSVAYSGGGGLAVKAPASAGTAVLRVNSGPVPLDPAAGGLVTAWVKIPEGAAGAAWRAQLQLQDSSWRWRGGAEVPLTPGVWARVDYRPSAEVWGGHRSVGVQFLSSHTGPGTQVAYVDEVRQMP